jgi:hypothetical protein
VSSPKTPTGDSGARSAQPLPMAGVAVPSLSGAVTASPACGMHSQGSKRGGSGLHVSKNAAGSSPKTPAGDSGVRSAQPLPMVGVAVPSMSGAITASLACGRLLATPAKDTTAAPTSAKRVQ